MFDLKPNSKNVVKISFFSLEFFDKRFAYFKAKTDVCYHKQKARFRFFEFGSIDE
jgi:hypothetical protein